LFTRGKIFGVKEGAKTGLGMSSNCRGIKKEGTWRAKKRGSAPHGLGE